MLSATAYRMEAELGHAVTPFGPMQGVVVNQAHFGEPAELDGRTNQQPQAVAAWVGTGSGRPLGLARRFAAPAGHQSSMARNSRNALRITSLFEQRNRSAALSKASASSEWRYATSR